MSSLSGGIRGSLFGLACGEGKTYHGLGTDCFVTSLSPPLPHPFRNASRFLGTVEPTSGKGLGGGEGALPFPDLGEVINRGMYVAAGTFTKIGHPWHTHTHTVISSRVCYAPV